VGEDSGSALIYGCQNTFLGSGSGNSLTLGNSNTAIGTGVGSTGLGTGCKNIYLGSDASSGGNFLGTESGNVVIGNANGNSLAGCSGHVLLSSGYSDIDERVMAVWNDCAALDPGGVADYGTVGYVLTSQGATAPPIWAAGGGGGGAATPTALGTVFGSTANANAALGLNVLAGTTGCYNTAIGFNSNSSGSSGRYNTTVGYASGVNLASGIQNTFIGTNSGSAVQTGSNNIHISNGGIPVFNFAPSSSNRLVLGSTTTSDSYVQVDWTVTSDARDKKVEGGVPHGLEFIKQLEPKAYRFKVDRDSEETHGPLRYGFLAQDIRAIEGPDGVVIDDEDLEHLKYRGESLVPILVNAVKELSAKNAELEARLAKLESTN
jgi:hypothetical protein